MPYYLEFVFEINLSRTKFLKCEKYTSGVLRVGGLDVVVIKLQSIQLFINCTYEYYSLINHLRIHFICFIYNMTIYNYTFIPIHYTIFAVLVERNQVNKKTDD